MVKNRENGPSAQWDFTTTIQYCDLCIIEIQKGNRPTTHFNKEGWTNIIKSFCEITTRIYDKMQLKNKWDQLKKEWKLWHDLKHGSTGLGWDPVRNTIMASDEWWTAKLQVLPAAKKFRTNGITSELEEKLEIMFASVVATGEHAWTPNSGQPPPEYTKDFENSDESNDDVPTQRIPVDVDLLHSSSGSKRPAVSQSKSKVQKRNKVGAGNKLASKIEELIDATTSMSAISPPTNRGLCAYDVTAEAISFIDSCDEIVQDDLLYGFALDLMEKKEKRNIFNNLSSARKVWYLKREFAKTI